VNKSIANEGKKTEIYEGLIGESSNCARSQCIFLSAYGCRFELVNGFRRLTWMNQFLGGAHLFSVEYSLAKFSSNRFLMDLFPQENINSLRQKQSL